jgi:hypothetical protein
VLVSDLPIVINNAKQILKKIKAKYPAIQVYPVLSNPDGQTPIDASLEYLIDECGYFFIESGALEAAWDLLDNICDVSEDLRYSKKDDSSNQILQAKIHSLKIEYKSLIPKLEINDDIEVCIRWDEIDFEINKQLGLDADLVDVSRSNTHIGGIKICLGTIGNLK